MFINKCLAVETLYVINLTSSTDCLPVGSPPVDDCSPCLVPPQDVPSTLARLLDSVCNLTTKITSWGQALGKIRNRLTALENTVKNLPGPSSGVANITCGGFTTTADETLQPLVCDSGVIKRFDDSSLPATQKMHLLEVPVEVFNDDASGTATLPDFPDVDGPIWAIFNRDRQVHFTDIGAGFTLTTAIGGRNAGKDSDRDSGTISKDFGIILVVDTSTPTVTLTFSGTACELDHLKLDLVGYIY